MKKIMITFPHADDVTINLGGLVRQWSNAGHEVYLVRITDDDADCAGIPTREEAIRINREEAEQAYSIIGAKKVIHLGYTSDTFGGIDFLGLREKIIKLLRQIKPNTSITFAMDGREEENMDHRITAYAVAEAHWTASFDLHHPEQFKGGLKPFCVGERLYFARVPEDNYGIFDVTDVMDTKIKAILSHKTVMKNYALQLKMRAQVLGLDTSFFNNNEQDVIIEKYMRKRFSGKDIPGSYEAIERLHNPSAGLDLLKYFK